LQNRLSRTGCLPNNHDIAHDRAAGDRRRLHPRAATALQQGRYMLVELDLDSLCSHGPVGRSHTA
jgi:hypothetical protein